MIGRGLAGGIVATLVLAASAAAGEPVLSERLVLSGADPFAGCATPNATPARTSEPSVAVDPRKPRRIAVAWLQGDGVGIVVASTVDGGRSWRHVVAPHLTTCSGGDLERVAHPRLAFAPDGGLHLAAFARRDGTGGAVARATVSRSGDGGASWGTPRRVDPEGLEAGVDFDTFAVEPDTGALLVTGSPAEAAIVAEPTVLARSTDDGRTWTRRLVHVSSPGTAAWNTVVAAGDGRLTVVFVASPLREHLGGERQPAAVQAVSSADHGRTWSSPVRIGTGAGFQWPAAAAGPDGTVHAAWLDADGEGPCRHFGTTSPGGACRVLTSRSAATTASWSAPATAGAWQASAWLPTPALAVTPHGDAAVAATTGADADGAVTGRVRLLPAHEPAAFDAVALGQQFRTAANAADTLGLYGSLAALPCGYAAAFVEDRPEARAADVVLQLARIRGCGQGRVTPTRSCRAACS